MSFSAEDVLTEFAEAAHPIARRVGPRRLAAVPDWHWRPIARPDGLERWAKPGLRNAYTFPQSAPLLYAVEATVRVETCPGCGGPIERRTGVATLYHVGGRFGRCPARRIAS